MVSAALAASCSSAAQPEAAPIFLEGTQFGYSVSGSILTDDAGYASIVRRDASIVTPENDMKWSRIQPERGEFDYSRADVIVSAAEENRQSVRGHVLIWHRQLPGWLKDGDWTRESLIAVMREHIIEVVSYYRDEFPGVVTQWDVVNEAFGSDGERRDSIWQRVIGDDYIDLAFRFAREADPDAVLFYNDFYDDAILSGGDESREDLGASAQRSSCAEVPKCVATRDLAEKLIRDGVPIEGIGFEGHIFDLEAPDYGELASWTGPLGLQWALTEVDVALPADDGDDSEALQAQADVYESMTRTCLEAPNCNTIVLWGVSDGQSWIPDETDGAQDHALLYDVGYEPKPAASAVLGAVAEFQS
jgi:endo-1,4-beta-xylanase